jgi:two-component sensor histidine kinase
LRVPPNLSSHRLRWQAEYAHERRPHSNTSKQATQHVGRSRPQDRRERETIMKGLNLVDNFEDQQPLLREITHRINNELN